MELITKEGSKGEATEGVMWFPNWELTQEITQESRKLSEVRALNPEIQYSLFVL